MTLDVDDLEVGQCDACGRVTFDGEMIGILCFGDIGDGDHCRGRICAPFRESTRIGWYDWPHRHLADDRLLVLEPLLTGFRLHVVGCVWDYGSAEVYDYPVDGPEWHAEALTAYRALHRWDGAGEPEGWYRHRPSNRRRPDGDPSREFVMP